MRILTYKGTGSLVAMVQTTLPRMTLLWLTSAFSSLNLHLLKSTFTLVDTCPNANHIVSPFFWWRYNNFGHVNYNAYFKIGYLLGKKILNIG